jgi:hypothetical protein
VSLLLGICAASTELLAQGVDVVATPRINQLEVFFLNDFDINSPGSGIPIFDVMVTNNTGQNIQVMLQMRIHTDFRGELLQAETGFFPMDTGLNRIINLTSNDLFTNTGPYRFETSEIADDILEDLLDDILRTGKLPTDTYNFDVVAVIEGGGQSDADGFPVRVTNPGKLDLIMPGSPFARIGDCQLLYTTLPLFRWETNFTKFRLVAAVIRPGEDPESALNQEPRFTRVLGLAQLGITNADLAELGFEDKVEIIPSTSYQYPPSGEILVFKPGDEVVWQVTGLVSTSAGVRQFESEIYCFQVADLQGLGSGGEQYNFILRNLLGADYDQLFGDSGEFDGFVPVSMRLNGEPVTPAELIPRIQELQQNYKGYRIE